MRTTERSQSLFDNSDREKHVIECPQPDQDMCTGSPTVILISTSLMALDRI